MEPTDGVGRLSLLYIKLLIFKYFDVRGIHFLDLKLFELNFKYLAYEFIII